MNRNAQHRDAGAAEHRYCVHVTAEDIAAGGQHSSERDPIVLAVLRSLGLSQQPQALSLRVSAIDFQLAIGPYDVYFPKPITQWVRDFDELGPTAVTPIEFDLIDEPPSRAHPIGRWRLELEV